MVRELYLLEFHYHRYSRFDNRNIFVVLQSNGKKIDIGNFVSSNFIPYLLYSVQVISYITIPRANLFATTSDSVSWGDGMVR